MYKRKLLILFTLIISFLMHEKVYEYIIKIENFSKIEDNILNIEKENIKKEKEELGDSYGYSDITDYNLEYSKVLYRNIYNLTDQITIYKGKNNNIKENNLVINEYGLVGIVSKVNDNSSIVELLTNSKTSISVKINDNYGILKYQGDKLVVTGLNNKSEVNIGDAVKTSNITSNPENILIGYVTNISLDKYEIEKIIEVSLSTNYDELKYVSVITSIRGSK